MQIQPEIFLIAMWAISAAILFAMFATHDRIIRHICQRDGWKYPVLWFFRPSWHRRLGFWTWWEAAKSAGYLKLELALFVLWLAVLAGAYALSHFGFIESRPPLISSPRVRAL
jgi:hypothetical protein